MNNTLKIIIFLLVTINAIRILPLFILVSSRNPDETDTEHGAVHHSVLTSAGLVKPSCGNLLFTISPEMEFLKYWREEDTSDRLKRFNLGRNVKARKIMQNVRRTIEIFKEEDPCLEVIIYNDTACLSLLRDTFPNLVQPFLEQDSKKGGAFKGDICRGAMLYNEGGLYLDVDLYPARSLLSYLREISDSNSTLHKHNYRFVAVQQLNSHSRFFNAIIYAEKHSPIIPFYMDNMLGYHMKQGQSNGCPALKHAYEKLKKEQPYFGPVKILEEARITNETRSDYLGNPSLQNGSGPGCNW
eukprot:CAMPEP_0204842284 /NCGR_PEP_ID=MMETSP1346-20131115/45619_1 /ASSEMBLY_ACC=CAM_ASM_000771 /TAXON_ID=215587 /ORGANISM="Aplanochytrium stocchinoi, Strain GSBS06" /LENGTH=298 /DNA_ID=CAMNT_0051980977 /DNA_START=184 /DNA_END=1077 /DNA_ORIENTATION=-